MDFFLSLFTHPLLFVLFRGWEEQYQRMYNAEATQTNYKKTEQKEEWTQQIEYNKVYYRYMGVLRVRFQAKKRICQGNSFIYIEFANLPKPIFVRYRFCVSVIFINCAWINHWFAFPLFLIPPIRQSSIYFLIYRKSIYSNLNYIQVISHWCLNNFLRGDSLQMAYRNINGIRSQRKGQFLNGTNHIERNRMCCESVHLRWR